MDELFATYADRAAAGRRAGSRRRSRATRRPPRDRAVQAKALDLLRGLLPAASLSHMGIYATGQTYEQLILHLLAHPLPEARALRRGDPRGGAGGHAELRLARRAPRPRRRVGRLPARARRRGAAAGSRASGSTAAAAATADAAERPAAARRRRRGRAAGRAAVRGRRRRRGGRRACAWPRWRGDERAALLGDLVGERGNRRHRPGPRLRGAALPLRDRLRLRRVPRPAAPPHADRAVAGADARPRRRRARGGRRRGLRRRVRRALDGLARRVRAPGRRRARERAAAYALCLGYRIRFVLDLNAREAMQLIELRSGREGHPVLPRRRPRDAPPDRAGAPRGRRRDDARGHRDRAAPGADPRRDAHPGPPGRARPPADGAGRAPGASVGPRQQARAPRDRAVFDTRRARVERV